MLNLEEIKKSFVSFSTDNLCNTKVKEYKDGSFDILFCSKAIFKPCGAELRSTCGEKPTKRVVNSGGDVPVTTSGLYRAKRKIIDYCLCNDFNYFVTLTLNGDDFCRSDWGAVVKKFNKWLSNRVERNNLKYIFVPEFHKDGSSIHFHGLINSGVSLKDSGTVKLVGGGKPIKLSTYNKRHNGEECSTVYNISDWKYGFSSAIPLYGDIHCVAHYISKYISKDIATGVKVGGRYYLSGGGLAVPKVSLLDCDFDEIVAEPWGIDGVPYTFKKLVFDKDGNQVVRE